MALTNSGNSSANEDAPSQSESSPSELFHANGLPIVPKYNEKKQKSDYINALLSGSEFNASQLPFGLVASQLIEVNTKPVPIQYHSIEEFETSPSEQKRRRILLEMSEEELVKSFSK